MEPSINMSFLYGGIAILAILVACGYFIFVKKKETWLICLFFSVFVADFGYFFISVSKNLQQALMGNRLAYLGCAFLPLFMLFAVMKVCKADCSKKVMFLLGFVTLCMVIITATQGITDLYYKEVSVEFVHGTAKLIKVYGPLHTVYYCYLFIYFALMFGIGGVSIARKKIDSGKHAILLLMVVFLNILIWLVEQIISWEFEFLAVSYIVSELLLVVLYGMMQDYENLKQQSMLIGRHGLGHQWDVERIKKAWPEAEYLSARETEVLAKILEDKKRKEIAEELFISENTVKKHTSSIFTKLGVSSRTELFEKMQSRL
ncbi:MAG: hypothetical protein IJX86_05660 [Lachnospiraceae bacterium]|nr:hypothetical protein [Lachnospiraceae bacterium]